MGNMKYAADPDSWLFKDTSSMCEQSSQKTFVNTEVKSCTVDFTGNFNKANISLLLGFSTSSCGPQTCGFCTRRPPGSLVVDLNSLSNSQLNGLNLSSTRLFRPAEPMNLGNTKSSVLY